MSDLHIVVRRKGVGDTIAVTPFIRDLKIAKPNIRLSVEGTLSDEIFRHDPRVEKNLKASRTVVIDYKDTHDRARMDKSARYLSAAHDDFHARTGVRIPFTSGRTDLVLSDEELAPKRERAYVVVASGAKLDMPLKMMSPSRWEKVVEDLVKLGYAVKQIGLLHDHRYPHIQDPVPGAENLLGKTGIRDVFSLIRHAAGVVCHTSMPMLVASAFNTPCVVVGGGREDPWLFADMGVSYLHTIGKLACCDMAGCRACFPVSVHGGEYPPGTLCADPVVCGDTWVGRCMTMISPDQIVETLVGEINSRRPR